MKKKVELLAPAGDLEKLIIAVEYGADAVYFSAESFGLRASAGNFTIEEIEKGVSYAHQKNKKCYMALNIFAHNEDIDKLEAYLPMIRHIPIDAFIVSDPGVIALLQEFWPDCEIHLSTQANTTNYASASFWHKMGVKRIVLARELSLEEIKELREKAPATLELEMFVHGAMCISYSGRCLLSNFMTGRDANRGACSHPCRWNYHLMEEQRPGEYMQVEEDERGTYFFNSKDLSLIKELPEILDIPVSSLKIEGRMKSIFYIAVTVGAYRKAIDQYYQEPKSYVFDENLLEELKKVSHRDFTTGFLYEKPDEKQQNYHFGSYVKNYSFLGMVKEYDANTGLATVEQRNKIVAGDCVEIFGPGAPYFEQTIDVLLDEENHPIPAAPHAQQIVKIKMNQPVGPFFMIRKALQ